MKSHTDLPQSKKLAEFLPIESSDMFYTLIDQGLYLEVKQGIEPSKDDIPCWSLAALLNIIPFVTIMKDEEGWYGECENGTVTSWNIELVDACVKMIEELHKQNLI